MALDKGTRTIPRVGKIYRQIRTMVKAIEMKQFFATVLTLLVILFTPSLNTHAQCCGAGNPVSSANSEASVKKRNLQIALDYRHSESNKYYEGSHEADFDFPEKSREQVTTLCLLA